MSALGAQRILLCVWSFLPRTSRACQVVLSDAIRSLRVSTSRKKTDWSTRLHSRAIVTQLQENRSLYQATIHFLLHSFNRRHQFSPISFFPPSLSKTSILVPTVLFWSSCFFIRAVSQFCPGSVVWILSSSFFLFNYLLLFLECFVSWTPGLKTRDRQNWISLKYRTKLPHFIDPIAREVGFQSHPKIG